MAVTKVNEDSWFSQCFLKPNCLNSQKSCNFGLHLVANRWCVRLTVSINLYIKGWKYNIEASKWMLWPAAIWTALWNNLLICLFHKQLIYYSRLMPSSSWQPLPLPGWCAELNWWPRLHQDGCGWQQEQDRQSQSSAPLLQACWLLAPKQK